MDDYLFKEKLDAFRTLTEKTTCIEIFNYSEPLYDVNQETTLAEDAFDDFLHRKGGFAPPENLPSALQLLSGIRIMYRLPVNRPVAKSVLIRSRVQQNAQHADALMPKVISLKKDDYEAMVRVMCLPTKHIETTAAVGPFFWHHYNRHDSDPCLQIIYRKSDTRKAGKTRGFEMVLSRSFTTKITNVFVRGTPSSDLGRVLQQLRANPALAGHPMALPVAFLAYDLAENNDERQREARTWLRHIENFTAMRGEGEENGRYNDVISSLDVIAKDLTECYAVVLWRPPPLYSALIDRMGKGMRLFANLEGLVQGEDLFTASPGAVAALRADSLQQLHDSLLSRLEFTQAKLTGLEHYRETTLERLRLQRETLSNIMSQRDSRLGLEMAKVAQASKRDGTAMKAISLMATLFLPGSYLASIFSMTFFNFQNSERAVSANLWIYFVITIPVTAALVASWLWFDRRQKSRYLQDDANFEKNINNMEQDIVRTIRRKAAGRSPWMYS